MQLNLTYRPYSRGSSRMNGYSKDNIKLIEFIPLLKPMFIIVPKGEIGSVGI